MPSWLTVGLLVRWRLIYLILVFSQLISYFSISFFSFFPLLVKSCQDSTVFSNPLWSMPFPFPFRRFSPSPVWRVKKTKEKFRVTMQKPALNWEFWVSSASTHLWYYKQASRCLLGDQNEVKMRVPGHPQSACAAGTSFSTSLFHKENITVCFDNTCNTVREIHNMRPRRYRSGRKPDGSSPKGDVS